MITWTLLRSTSSRVLVRVTAGCVAVSSDVSSTLRPARVWWCSSRNRRIPFSISFPGAARAPVLVVRNPRRIGSWAADTRPARAPSTQSAARHAIKTCRIRERIEDLLRGMVTSRAGTAARAWVSRFDMLPVLVEKKDQLYKEVSSGVHTNMTLDQVVRLAVMASQVPTENIKRGVLGKGYVLFGTSPDNLSILIPLADKVH